MVNIDILFGLFTMPIMCQLATGIATLCYHLLLLLPRRQTVSVSCTVVEGGDECMRLCCSRTALSRWTDKSYRWLLVFATRVSEPTNNSCYLRNVCALSTWYVYFDVYVTCVANYPLISLNDNRAKYIYRRPTNKRKNLRCESFNICNTLTMRCVQC